MPDGRFVWISEETYSACADAWQHSAPDAGTCEWAGDVAGAYESAPVDPVEVVAYAICGDDQAMEDRYISAGYHAEASAALRALGMPG